ncbi:peptigoglycan-binding protein LysM [Bradyrhizobium sp. WBOS7]|uniref:Peptigoglycan-binding protein LysM n=1 Tax=Bradyrhizobium betae TaxID=244734 RepID=A0AAE9N6M9_9BRAD|nr:MULTISPECIES: DUF2235 domain-containing protein [Bradyrhizobium]MDD1572696.1 peptigoglycan-binding protein LysM [Bradyrhizobium sp. WBOS1]UUO33546.1 peptigoglycan-binding protein LysM [Bradyrhizobium sp. WBOS01]MDD1528035.1 peptigoglycan-binding protein LysM [Bradyrhizobium sp. WBOS2]MDD1578615.1 peptigoglycan-binding protein LysM [Bradyrhizobium sp. WBOS7]MDD1603177.1 peptigoglycan-binding protein LysM [Bradyrhizobium sp. WBOS16]
MKKRLVFCFDGTWNSIDAKNPTNVLLTAESVLPLTEDSAQFVHYDQGVGTAGGKLDEIKGGVFGDGLVRNLAEAYQNLIFNHTPGDEIYAFGFSRGAFTARSFAGLISNCGILDRRHASQAKNVIELYRGRDGTADYASKLMEFRAEYCCDTWLSDEECEWRKTKERYPLDDSRRVNITYLGVWDTVGALGIPKNIAFANKINAKHQFHDTRLSSFVRSARHAVAIDERRDSFEPTLWDNLAELNQKAGSPDDAFSAPYQQMWFPGVHSSVGGSADWRGLSDQALHWVWLGAMRMGLQFDTEQNSRIFELRPKFTDKLEHSDAPGFQYRAMKGLGAYRMPGPEKLHEVSFSARRRWHEDPKLLPEGKLYRPATLNRVAAQLRKVDPVELGVTDAYRSILAQNEHEMYVVQKKDVLRAIAKRFYGNANDATKIFDANRDVLDNPDLIFANQTLRLPKDGMLVPDDGQTTVVT